MKRTLAILLGSLFVSLATPASAQPSAEDQAASDALFDAARGLMEEGKNGEACPKLEEAQRLAPGIGILFHLASCYEATGRTASAWSHFRTVVTMAQKSGNEAQENPARERVARLTPRLTRLRIDVPPEARVDGLEVRRDDVLVGAGAWGTEVPVDPGEHVLHLSAPGRASQEARVSVVGEGAVVPFVVPPLVEAAPGPQPPPPPLPEVEGGGVSWQVPVGVVALGLGAAGLGAGIGVGFMAKSKADDAECDGDDVCTQAGLDTRADALSLGNAATGVFVAGAVLGLVGIIVVATAPAADDEVALQRPHFDRRSLALRF